MLLGEAGVATAVVVAKRDWSKDVSVCAFTTGTDFLLFHSVVYAKVPPFIRRMKFPLITHSHGSARVL